MAAPIAQWCKGTVERVGGCGVDIAETYKDGGQCVSQDPYAASHVED